MTMIREPKDWQEDWCNFKPEEFRCSHCGALEIHSDILDLLIYALFTISFKFLLFLFKLV